MSRNLFLEELSDLKDFLEVIAYQPITESETKKEIEVALNSVCKMIKKYDIKQQPVTLLIKSYDETLHKQQITKQQADEIVEELK